MRILVEGLRLLGEGGASKNFAVGGTSPNRVRRLSSLATLKGTQLLPVYVPSAFEHGKSEKSSEAKPNKPGLLEIEPKVLSSKPALKPTLQPQTQKPRTEVPQRPWLQQLELKPSVLPPTLHLLGFRPQSLNSPKQALPWKRWRTPEE